MRKNLFQQLRNILLLLILSSVISGCGYISSKFDDLKSLISKEDKSTNKVSSNKPKNTNKTNKEITIRAQESSGFIRSASNRARTNLGTFVIPGISLSRWKNSKDVSAWRDTNQPLINVQIADEVIHDIGVSRNGAFMASIGAQINIWDLDSLSLIRSWELDSVGREIALTPDGGTIISVHEDNTIRIWQQETGFNIAILQHSRSISAMTVSEDGSRIASADTGGNIFIWDTVTGKQLYSIDDILRVNTLKFSRDGLRLASSGISSNDVNYTVQIWETRFYSLEVSLPGHRAVVNNVNFSPNEKYVVTASRDNTIRIWDLNKGSLYKILRGHTDDVVKTVFSDDGYWLISSSLDDRIRIWSFPNGRAIQSLTIPYLRSKSLEYVSNRNWILVVGGGNQDIQIWASSGFTYKPWDDIRKRVSRLYKDRQKVLSLPLIPKPQLPSLSNLRKDPFESQLVFVNRAARIYGPRINKQIVNYRKKVDERNKKIAILRQNQRDSRTLVNKQIRDIAIRTTKKVLGETILFPLSIDGRPAYDPDQQLMKIRVSFTRAFYREDFLLKMPQGAPAKLFYKELSKGTVIGNGVFDFISESRVRLSKIHIRWRGRKFIAKPRRLSSGDQIVPSALRDATISAEQLQFQRYGIPYTNFSDFIRAILREQLKNDLEVLKSKPIVNPETSDLFPSSQSGG